MVIWATLILRIYCIGSRTLDCLFVATGPTTGRDGGSMGEVDNI